MKKIKSLLIQVVVFIVVILLVMVFRPVPHGNINNSAIITGTVVSIVESSSHDINIDIEENHDKYYINRGAASGLDAIEMRTLMAGKEIMIWYSTHWTPLDPNNHSHHVYRLDFGDEVIYNEM